MRLVVLFLLLFVFQISFSQDLKLIRKGSWKGELAMNDRLNIPFSIDFSFLKDQLVMEIVNADERLKMKLKSENDSVTAFFPESEAFLKFKLDQNNNEIRGYWINPNKKSIVKIPFNAWYNNEITEMAANTSNISGRWKTTFSPNSQEPENAVGLFEQTAGTIKGTFLTETGDYRYLGGTIGTNKFSLSTFNGSWAFLFEGKVVGDSLYGDFYSGQSYHSSWVAKRDAQAQLKDESSLTYVINDMSFQFKNVKDFKGDPFIYPNKKLKDKVVVFQIMGTWCPNCIDETKYLSELYKEYHKRGVEIIGLAYENGSNQNAQIKRLKAFQKRLKVPYKILLAGSNSKEVASEQFPMLNGIMSFPTTIMVDKTGKIRFIYTGFSGPATGTFYKELKEVIRYDIEDLLGLLE